MAGLPVIVALVASVGSVQAGLDTPIDFNMPAGDLARTLVAISRQGGIMISFPPEVAAGRRAIAIQGRLTVREALAGVLAGTGLRMVPGAGGSVTVVADTGASPSAAAAGLGDIAAIDVTDEGGVSRFGDVGFQAGSAGDTVRLAGVAAKDIPLSVNAVTSNVIRSQVATNAGDVAQNVSGVTIGTTANGSQNFIIRGAPADNVTINGQGFSNGALNSGFSQMPIDDVERVEVLKGPTSILNGASSLGGSVNIATKQPTNQVIRNATIRYGSFNYRTIAFDFGGPVADTENLTFRFNISNNHADENFAGYRDAYQYLISPSVRYDNGDISILAGVRYRKERRLPGQYTFVEASNLIVNENFNNSALMRPLRIPRGVPYVNPRLSIIDETIDVYSDQTLRFGDILGVDATFNNHFFYSKSKNEINSFQWPATLRRSASDPINTYRTSQNYLPYDFETITNRADLTLMHDAGFARQTSKFGIDYQALSTVLGTLRNAGLSTNAITGLPYYPLISVPDYSFLPNMNVDLRNSYGVGYYYIDQIDTLDNRLHILGSVRYDRFRQRFRNPIFVPDPTNGQILPDLGSGLSWLAGAAFDVTPYFTVYGSRNVGFRPNYSTQRNGQPLPPGEADQWEIGGRFFLFDKKLTVTTSYSDMFENNTAICDPTDCRFAIPISGLSTTAFEIDVQGEVYPGLNLIASFGQAIAKYATSEVLPALSGRPQFTGSLWTTYTFQGGPLQGVTLGFGG
ncbi:TonB-dependent receptor [Methylobacterium sp. Leaf123]|uniref:TonB-dependent siderophore receptor n=1 Tax=Methylobacterium sp. Leaf123 TaxID=1736264 RepID=UPI00138F08D6|nr:TonB-dependent receptor [Methylobacterium sp. Leaf123]